MPEKKNITPQVLDKVEEALEERQVGKDRRVFSVELPTDLERRSGKDRREEGRD